MSMSVSIKLLNPLSNAITLYSHQISPSLRMVGTEYYSDALKEFVALTTTTVGLPLFSTLYLSENLNRISIRLFLSCKIGSDLGK